MDLLKVLEPVVKMRAIVPTDKKKLIDLVGLILEV